MGGRMGRKPRPGRGAKRQGGVTREEEKPFILSPLADLMLQCNTNKHAAGEAPAARFHFNLPCGGRSGGDGLHHGRA
jgi:hypothetical protein